MNRFLTFLVLCVCFTQTALHAGSPTFTVDYPRVKKPLVAPRVYIVISESQRIDPVENISNWFNLPKLCARNELASKGKVVIDAKCVSNFDWEKLDGDYNVQAVVRLNPDWPVPGHGEGDYLSEPRQISFTAGENKTFHFDADQLVGGPVFRKKGRIQDHYYRSKKLSKFHHRDVRLRYSVILPKDWDKKKKYPVIYYVTGFGGVHHTATSRIDRFIAKRYEHAIVVIADANCYWGHSVFADSAINGPWGSALTTELIPHIDQTYGGAGAKHRYVTGSSSGGWTSLWLTVNYPESFRACWAVAPDPVDFSKFQQLNLTDKKADNLFVDKEGEERLLSIKRLGLAYRDFANYERVLGPGGQLLSFAAVFSPTSKTGSPMPWYNAKTGVINQQTCKQWQQFDISRLMQKNWKTLQPKLKGKINVIVHKEDLFHLNYAVSALEKTCQRLGSDATFTYHNGRGHHMPLSSYKKMLSVIEKNSAELWELD